MAGKPPLPPHPPPKWSGPPAEAPEVPVLDGFGQLRTYAYIGTYHVFLGNFGTLGTIHPKEGIFSKA